MRRMLSCMAAILCGSIGLTTLAGDTAAQGVLANLPRNETLILENPEGTVKNAGWFNIWAINAGSQSNGLQQAALDTLWYIDPNQGLDGVCSENLERGFKRGLREGVRVFADEQRAVRACLAPVVTDRLSNCDDVRLVEGTRERGAAMAAGAERDPLRAIGDVGLAIIELTA